MSADWTLLVDPSDAVLEGARSVFEPRLDVVAVDDEADALYALGKWERPKAVMVALALDSPEDGLPLARKLRSEVGDEVLVVVYGKAPTGSQWEPEKLLLRYDLDLLLLHDLGGRALGLKILDELRSGKAKAARAARIAEEMERVKRGEDTRDDPSSVLLGMRKRIQREAASASPDAAASPLRRDRESSWEEIMEAPLNWTNLKVLWAKGNGRPAYLPKTPGG